MPQNPPKNQLLLANPNKRDVKPLLLNETPKILSKKQAKIYDRLEILGENQNQYEKIEI